jgi:putative endonuclease
MSKHLELGKKGEDLATAYLQKKGYQILERNYRFKHLEIDVICQDKDELVIVEVKTRTTNKLGAPEQISISKQKQIIRATNHYVQERNCELEIRMDVIGIILNQYEEQVIHIEGAYVPF